MYSTGFATVSRSFRQAAATLILAQNPTPAPRARRTEEILRARTRRDSDHGSDFLKAANSQLPPLARTHIRGPNSRVSWESYRWRTTRFHGAIVRDSRYWNSGRSRGTR